VIYIGEDQEHRNLMRENSMRNFTIAVAAIGIVALFAGAPASAQHQPGGPMKTGSQCWKSHGGAEGSFGHFEACPQPASNPAPARRQARQRG
jgi:hypothetical protein